MPRKKKEEPSAERKVLLNCYQRAIGIAWGIDFPKDGKVSLNDIINNANALMVQVKSVLDGEPKLCNLATRENVPSTDATYKDGVYHA